MEIIITSSVVSPCKHSVMRDLILSVNLNKLLNKQWVIGDFRYHDAHVTSLYFMNWYSGLNMLSICAIDVLVSSNLRAWFFVSARLNYFSYVTRITWSPKKLGWRKGLTLYRQRYVCYWPSIAWYYAICGHGYITILTRLYTGQLDVVIIWWRHQMAGVTSEFPSQRPVTRSYGVFFDLGLWINGWVNKIHDINNH